jgi:hypothetical protein
MVSFVMIVGAVFSQDARQGCLTKENQLGETFLLDRADPSLRERIGVSRRMQVAWESPQADSA